MPCAGAGLERTKLVNVLVPYAFISGTFAGSVWQHLTSLNTAQQTHTLLLVLVLLCCLLTVLRFCLFVAGVFVGVRLSRLGGFQTAVFLLHIFSSCTPHSSLHPW